MKTLLVVVIVFVLSVAAVIAETPIIFLDIRIPNGSTNAHVRYSVAADYSYSVSVRDENGKLIEVSGEVDKEQLYRIKVLMSKLPVSHEKVKALDCVSVAMMVPGTDTPDIVKKNKEYDRMRLPLELEEIIKMLGGVRPELKDKIKFASKSIAKGDG